LKVGRRSGIGKKGQKTIKVPKRNFSKEEEVEEFATVEAKASEC